MKWIRAISFCWSLPCQDAILSFLPFKNQTEVGSGEAGGWAASAWCLNQTMAPWNFMDPHFLEILVSQKFCIYSWEGESIVSVQQTASAPRGEAGLTSDASLDVQSPTCSFGFRFQTWCSLWLTTCLSWKWGPLVGPQMQFVEWTGSYTRKCDHKMTLRRQQQHSVWPQQIVVDW